MNEFCEATHLKVPLCTTNIGSKPRLSTIGNTMGKVSRITGKASIRAPSGIYIRSISTRITMGGRPSPVIQPASTEGRLVTVRKTLNIIAPMRIVSAKQVVRTRFPVTMAICAACHPIKLKRTNPESS